MKLILDYLQKETEIIGKSEITSLVKCLEIIFILGEFDLCNENGELQNIHSHEPHTLGTKYFKTNSNYYVIGLESSIINFFLYVHCENNFLFRKSRRPYYKMDSSFITTL